MGSSYSSRTRNNLSSKGKRRCRGSNQISDSDSTTRTDEDNNVAPDCDRIERKDSKKYWISQIKFRRSSNDLKRTSSEKKAEVRTNPKSTSTSKQNSKIVQKKGFSMDSQLVIREESISSKDPSADSGKTASDSCTGSGRNENGGLSGNSTVTRQSVKWKSLSSTELYNILNDGALTAFICDPTYILLLDARSKQEYQNSHILMAKHATELTDKTLQTTHYGGLNNLIDYTWIVIYGDGFTDGDESTPELKLIKELEGIPEIDINILTTGFRSFYNPFSFMCSEEERVNYKSLKVYPSMILDHQLYQGRGDQATDLEVVNDLQITHIINITQEHKSAFPEKINYLTLKLDDVSHTQLIQHFEKTTKFLTDALCNGGCVLVHCNLGVSRSSTVTIAYLIQSKGWTLKEAHEFVKERRSCIRPNRGFLQQLAVWEELKLGKRFTDPDDLWF